MAMSIVGRGDHTIDEYSSVALTEDTWAVSSFWLNVLVCQAYKNFKTG